MANTDNNANNNEMMNSADQNGEISIMQLLHVIRIRFWIVILFVLLALCAGFTYLYYTVPVYETTATALVTPISSSATSIESLLSTSSSSSKISTEVQLITSQKNLAQALSLLDLHQYKDENGVPYDEREAPITAAGLAKKVSVTTVSDTNVVKITVSDSNPQFCRDLVNAIVTSYSEVLNTIAKNSKTAQREFLEEQIPLNEAKLAEAMQKLADFKQESGIIQLTEKNTILSKNVSNLQLQKEPLLHQQVEQQALYAGYKDALTEAGFSPESVEVFSSDPAIAETLEKVSGWTQEILMYQALGLSEEDLSTSSRIYSLNSSVSNAQKEILSAINAELRLSVSSDDPTVASLRVNYAQTLVQLMLIERNIEAIDQTIEYYTKELSSYPQIERQAEELQRNVEVYQALSVTLRQMYEETKLLEAAISGYVTTIDRGSLPLSPIKPRKLMILAVSILAGGVIGVLLTLYLDYKDVYIRNSEIVSQILGPTIPELGWVPLMNSKYFEKYGHKLVTLSRPNSFAAERISVVASNTIYSAGPESMKVIGVNSAAKGEGKTTMVCNLAVAYATMGKKVLLIDGDLRRPSVSSAFELKSGKKGITDLVVNRADLKDVLVRPVKGMDNLHILPVGHVTKNPSIIFASRVFENFIAVARKHYDIILIDTPPVSAAPEVASAIKLMDGIIINIRAGITTKPELQFLKTNLTLLGANIVGYIFSGVILNRRRASYSYGYGYAHSYGHGHGYAYSYSSSGNKAKDNDERGMLISSRKMGRAYRRVYERELRERENLDKSKFAEPVYLASLGLTDEPEDNASQSAVPDTQTKPQKGGSFDPLAAIESDEASSGKK